MDVRAYISKVVFKLNERPDLTSNVPDIVGYRWFLENTKTLMSFEEWKANCLWVISPQQLAVDSSTFTESLSRVNTLGVKVTIERPKAYKNAKMQYREADFWPSKDAGVAAYPVARRYTSPKFQLKLQFVFDNHSLVLNSKREVLLRKNTLKASGVTGLVRNDRGLPHMKGLLAGASAPSSGTQRDT